MQRPGRRAWAWVSPFLGALLLLEGILVPMLERAEGGRQPVLESEHSAATCVVRHDHTICIQVGANRAASAARIRVPLPVLAFARTAYGRIHQLPAPAPERGRQPRGPPLA